MQSTIKKNYERAVAPDGTVTLEYKGKRLNAHQVAASGMAQLVVLIAGCYATFGIYYVLHGMLGNVGDTISIVAGAVLTLYVLRKLFYARTYQLTLTRDGIIFPRSSYGASTGQLPYGDIDDLGVTTYSSSGQNGFYQSTNVYASAGGTEVKITRFIPQTLADAIIREINAKMGKVHSLARAG